MSTTTTKRYRIPVMTVHLVRERTATLRCDRPSLASGIVRELCCVDAARERMCVLYLDGKSNVRGAEVVSQGGQHGCVVTPADIFRGAIMAGASAIILGHNHPGGDPTPSAPDIHMTEAIARAGEIVGIQLVDHLIVTDCGRVVSMADEGLLAH